MPRAELFRRWVVAFTLGELVGFGALPVAGGVLAYWLTAGLDATPRALALYAVAVLGGLGEGYVLARFQLAVLRRTALRVDEGRWARDTALAAAAAWALGMLPATLDDVIGLAPAAQVALWVPAAILILLSIGGAQARVLAGRVPRPRRWLYANVGGWLLGLPWTFFLPGVLPDEAPPAAFAGAMLIGGVLMGATAGAVTGRTLLVLVDDAEDELRR